MLLIDFMINDDDLLHDNVANYDTSRIYSVDVCFLLSHSKFVKLTCFIQSIKLVILIILYAILRIRYYLFFSYFEKLTITVLN